MSRQVRFSLSRRRLLRALLAVPFLGLAPRAVLGALDAATPRPGALAAQAPSPPVGGLDGIDAVGSLYLHLHPDEASGGSLREALGLSPEGDPSRDTKRLARRSKADFEADDIVALDGWRLSRTEARWAALLHLDRAGPG